jgi:hypothetical protein
MLWEMLNRKSIFNLLVVIICLVGIPGTVPPSSITLGRLSKQDSQEPFEETYGLLWHQIISTRDVSHQIWIGLEREDQSVVCVGTSASSYQIVGTSESHRLLELSCFNVDGELQWNRQYLISSTADNPALVNQWNRGFLMFFSDNGSVCCWEFDEYGKNIGNTTYTPSKYVVVRDATRLSISRVMVIGEMRPASNVYNASDIWLASFDNAGTLRWNKTIKIEGQAENPSKIIVYQSTRMLIVGTREVWGESFEGRDIFAMDLDVNGTLLWEGYYEGDSCRGVLACDEGGFLLFKQEYVWPWFLDYGVVRINDLGQELWHRNSSTGDFYFRYRCLLQPYSDLFVIIGINQRSVEGQGINASGDIVMPIQIILPILNPIIQYGIACSDGTILCLGWDYDTDQNFIVRLGLTKRPLPPFLFMVGSLIFQSAFLAWTPSRDQEGYVTQYQIQMAPYANFSRVSSNDFITGFNWVNSTLPPSTYCFRVRGINSMNVISNWSNIIQVRILSQIDIVNLLSFVFIDVCCSVVIVVCVIFLLRKSKGWKPDQISQET